MTKDEFTEALRQVVRARYDVEPPSNISLHNALKAHAVAAAEAIADKLWPVVEALGNSPAPIDFPDSDAYREGCDDWWDNEAQPALSALTNDVKGMSHE